MTQKVAVLVQMSRISAEKDKLESLFLVFSLSSEHVFSGYKLEWAILQKLD